MALLMAFNGYNIIRESLRSVVDDEFRRTTGERETENRIVVR